MRGENALQVAEVMSIGTLSERTGVSIETLRIWERRHGALAPRRSSGSHRRYDSTDVERVKWLAARVSAGQRISAAVAALEAVGLAPISASRPTLAEALVDASIRADGERVERELDRAFGLFPLTHALELAVFPALTELATRWTAGERTIAAEHMLSEAVTRRLATRLSEARPAGGSPTAVFCPSGERHVIGALALALLVVAAGRAIVFLGADTPLDEVDHLTANRHIGSAVAVCTMPRSANVVRAHLDPLRRPPRGWGVAGPAFDEMADRTFCGVPVLGPDLEAATDRLCDVTATRRHRNRKASA